MLNFRWRSQALRPVPSRRRGSGVASDGDPSHRRALGREKRRGALNEYLKAIAADESRAAERWFYADWLRKVYLGGSGRMMIVWDDAMGTSYVKALWYSKICEQ